MIGQSDNRQADQNLVFLVLEYIGYDNSSYFYRRFRLRYGCSPKEYRARENAALQT